MAQSPPFPSAGQKNKRPPRRLLIFSTIFIALGSLLPMLVGVFTDWQWFGEVDYRGVFTRVIVIRLLLFLAFGLVGAAVIWLTGFITYKLRPPEDPAIDPASPLAMYRRAVTQSLRKILVILPAIVGIGAGVVGQANWTIVAMALNHQSFGQKDPQFHLDYGFYAFILPLLNLLTSFFSLLIFVAFLVALIGHYLLGNIRLGSVTDRAQGGISASARAQLAVIAGTWMLVKVAGYWLDRYGLLSKTHGLAQQGSTFTGGNYTDINAILPAKILLMVVAMVVAVAFFSTVVLKDLRIPALATGLMVLSAVIIGQGWPAAVEQFRVAPNRAELESTYIKRNIEATRYAYGLTDDKVTYKENWGANGAPAEAVASDSATLSNIRLLDPQILSDTFTQRQQLKNFYGFPNKLTIDRYTVDGQLRDYVVAAREINPAALTDNQRDWINRHTVYTHGNGLVAAPANKVDEVARDVGSTRGGYPIFVVSDLQTLERQKENEDAEKLGIEVTEPRIYFGPVISSGPQSLDYAIVGAKPDGRSLEYDTDNATYTYTGSGGVSLGNIINRAAFALRYQEINMLLSDRIDGNAKILFNRDPRSRVEKVAPWLTTDSNTYPTVIDGRIKWIVDGYTTLDSLPYSQTTQLRDATRDALNAAGTSQRLVSNNVGYIRNSVKAVVDAYDGSVQLYAFDESDPVLKAWRGIFPDSVKPRSEISEELLEHLRYPEDMFKVQREIIAKYHVDDARVFFTSDAFWSVPGDPTIDGKEDNLAQPPYYVVAADPETKQPSFQLITPFRGFERQFLASHMTVSSDPDTYGRITLRVLPTNTQTFGPAQAQDTMMSSDQIARDRTLWQETNDITNGNLLTLPVGGGEILYVEPVYTKRKGQESAFPKLLRVLVYYKGNVGYAPTIAEALSQVGIDPHNAVDIDETEGLTVTTPTDSGETATNNADADKVSDLPVTALPENQAVALERIREALAALKQAQASGTHQQYGRALDELDKAVSDYQQLAGMDVNSAADPGADASDDAVKQDSAPGESAEQPAPEPEKQPA